LHVSQEVASEQVSQFSIQARQLWSGVEYVPAGQLHKGSSLEFYYVTASLQMSQEFKLEQVRQFNIQVGKQS
jgi:hypothetical protein